MKDGILDGHLTPFRVRQIETSLDEYKYSQDDDIISGEIDKEKTYLDRDWNNKIYIPKREQIFVKKLFEKLPKGEKAIIFCANQPHAAKIRDFINQELKPSNVDYCVRVTSHDGEQGEAYLRRFRNNENTVPTILTTSHKLSTGVDAKNLRHVVLFRKVDNIIEFKQIIGRGTRVFDTKEYFTIHDFYGNHKHFADPDWDGEPLSKIIEIDNTTNTKNTDDDNIDTNASQNEDDTN